MAVFAGLRLLSAFPAQTQAGRVPKASTARPNLRRIRAEPMLNPHQTLAGIQNPPDTRPQSGFATAPATKPSLLSLPV